MAIPKFHGTITAQGKAEWDIPRGIPRWVSTFHAGQRVTLTIQEYHDQRSHPANKMFLKDMSV